MGPFRLYFGVIHGYLGPKPVYINFFWAILDIKKAKKVLAEKMRTIYAIRGTVCIFVWHLP